MKISNGTWNLVLAGKWNRYLLSPQWVGKNIFCEPELQVEFALNLELPPRYTSKEKSIRFVPAEDKVIFYPLNQSDQCLSAVEKLADKLLELLPHTPISAFGINFGFIEEANTKLYEYFNISDNGQLGNFDCVLKETSITRAFSFQGKDLNLTMKLNGNKVNFGFNFHYPVKSVTEARNNLKGNILINKKYAEDLLASVYKLVCDSSEGDIIG